MKYSALLFATLLPGGWVAAKFQAGAAKVDIAPDAFPVLVNGGFLSREADSVSDSLHARSLVLSNGKVQVAIVVVDSCMMPRDMLDKAKALAASKTGIRTDHMLVSATHTHTAPSSFSALGTPADPRYVPFLVQKVAESIEAAQKNLRPAKAGWHSVQAPEFTAVRRWILRPGRMELDPFGNRTVRASMHAGRNWDNVTGESGPEDPELSMISIRDDEDRPLAVLANFSMHYFAGVKALSSDYFGRFCDHLCKKIPGADDAFVGILSHGCSGDIWRRDYTRQDWSKDKPSAQEQIKLEDYAEGLARRAMQGFAGIEYSTDLDLAMAELRLPLQYRVPDVQRLQWARSINETRGDRLPKSREEVYAMEQVILHEKPATEVVLQALRIGDMAIATTPNETYALTGLKLKAMSPLPRTLVIELANGADGYIPPPEQHYLGGYNTWPARSAGLEVQAEPKIVEASLQLLEKVARKSRRIPVHAPSHARKSILETNPMAFWTMDEFSGPLARDISSNERSATFEDGVVFHLKGADQQAAHFCGGRLRADFPDIGDQYTLSMHVWNGMPANARKVSGWLFSRDYANGTTARGDHFGINGDGRLRFRHGHTLVLGKHLPYRRWQWMQVTFIRKDTQILGYIGRDNVLFAESPRPDFPKGFGQLFIGGRSDNTDNWEGRIDEIVLYDRALGQEELFKKVLRK